MITSTITSPLPMITSTIPSWMKYIFDPIVPSLMMISPATQISTTKVSNDSCLLSLNNYTLIYTSDLAEKLRTEALWQLRRRKRGRHLWRKAPRQPKPDSCSWSHPHAASPRAPRESVLRRRIYPDTCAQNTWESGRVKNQVLFLKITQWSCFLCLAAVSCRPCTPQPASLSL